MQEAREPTRPDRTPLDPSGLVVRYADRSKGWGRAMDRIDQRIRQRQVNETRRPEEPCQD